MKGNIMLELFVKKSLKINASAAKVWDIIISPETWEEWMLVLPEVENGQPLSLGSRVLWKGANGNAYLIGTVTTLKPKKKLVFELQDVSWTRKANPGEVTYALELSEQNGTTRVGFSLGDLSIDPEAEEWFYGYTESHELEDIKRLAEANTPILEAAIQQQRQEIERLR
jgi:uncharacterized protein YndB with AHSA1/START domain